MAEEKVYNVPLRKGYQNCPMWRRSKKAVSTLYIFLMRHMKCELTDIRIGKYLNEAIWTNGIKNPPHHVKIHAIRDDKGLVRVELVGHEISLPKEKKAEPKTMVDKLKQKMTPEEGKPEAKKEAKKEEPKKEQKEEPKKELAKKEENNSKK